MWINLRSGRPIEQKNTRGNIDDIVTTQARKKREKEHMTEKKQIPIHVIAYVEMQ